MGNFGTNGTTLKNVIDEILEDFSDRELLKEHTINRECGNRILWMVIAGKNDTGPFQCILCYVFSKHGKEWTYKPLDETTGPVYSSVPVEWFDKYPCIYAGKQINMAWRNKVRTINIGHELVR
jgi:hypothetical protein